jgi:phosphoglycolate phosphatase-like HAD superfamily hydrolase
MDALLDRYVERLHAELSRPGFQTVVLDGIPELLDALEARDDVTMGLLTGNLEAGARAKLTSAGIDPSRFRVGAFGSDHEHRPELPAIARQRFHAVEGIEIPGGDVIVIGDTPADIECARSIDARAIGVGTGRYSVAELASHGAAAVFTSLVDTEAVVHAIVDA